MKTWFKSGSPWIWLSGAAVSLSLIMVVGLVAFIAYKGLGIYWPATLHQYELANADGSTDFVVGEIYDTEIVSRERIKDSGVTVAGDEKWISRMLLKTGNRDIYGSDFRWIIEKNAIEEQQPKELVTFVRREWGNLYGFLDLIKENNVIVSEKVDWADFEARLAYAAELHDAIEEIEKHKIGSVNYDLERLRLERRKLEIDNRLDAAATQDLKNREQQLDQVYQQYQTELASLYKKIKRDSVSIKIADGRMVDVHLAQIVRAYKPNAMTVFQKIKFYLESIWLFVSEDPREANTEGGIFPAIFGTVMMVLIMSIIVTPFGIIAAVYLREYAKQDYWTRTIRIAVNNLAGVPSIVYGIFGLGFFVYFLGGNIDQLFFPEALPAPTFGTPGILWASLTLAILTLPVVIVATEEGLSRVPKSIREGSLALGATKWETLRKTVLPMASPAMMTGLILAVARAAGEVAPLMLVGVVKLAPSLPLDENFPFLHLDRKFMHLGFHIYDVGFQSPNVEAARPLVYATALLLIVVIIFLNLAAISIRNRLREKYKGLDH
ncbi:MAG TPA: phosphate ABC transporter permease PstA [Gammaproteobacteria bacterium]|nr:phosphate ABC transporter permease PstA [Gammaproteobacteria bacterium]